MPVCKEAVHGIVRPLVYAVPAALYCSKAQNRPLPAMSITINAVAGQERLVCELTKVKEQNVSIKQVAEKPDRLTYGVTVDECPDSGLETMLEFRANYTKCPLVRVPLIITNVSAE
jgi:hypothetical protein